MTREYKKVGEGLHAEVLAYQAEHPEVTYSDAFRIVRTKPENKTQVVTYAQRRSRREAHRVITGGLR